MNRRTGSVIAATGLLGAFMLGAPLARAYDEAAYLFNVYLRPGYNFTDQAEALAYGYGICGKIEHGETYGQLVSEIKADFQTDDEYQATYLITQATNELCPSQIWQLRRSVIHDGEAGTP